LSEEKPRENKRFEAEHTEEKRRAHEEESARFKFGQIKDWASRLSTLRPRRKWYEETKVTFTYKSK
jgi:hypothetical protein